MTLPCHYLSQEITGAFHCFLNLYLISTLVLLFYCLVAFCFFSHNTCFLHQPHILAKWNNLFHLILWNHFKSSSTAAIFREYLNFLSRIQTIPLQSLLNCKCVCFIAFITIQKHSRCLSWLSVWNENLIQQSYNSTSQKGIQRYFVGGQGWFFL